MIKKICNKIDNTSNKNLVVIVFLFLWVIINMIQSFFTDLHPDEAYYWMYSRKLSWGYFDHPPVVAILIKAGYAIFQNELGVRLFFIFLGALTIYLIYKIVEEYIDRISLFILLVSSIVIIHSHVGGFLSIPDVPVVFFAAIFFYVYKQYLIQDSWKLAILIGIICGAMLYSKYHGLLVIFFTLAANLKIIKRSSFWLIPVITVLIMLPHLFWQIKNHFPTFEYHIFARSSSYKLDYTLNYIIGQLLIAGPFVGVIIFYHASKKVFLRSNFERVLYINFWGFLLFFLLMSFKGRVESHWTAVAFIPGTILTLIGIKKSKKALRWLQVLFIPTIVSFLFLRVALMVPMLPDSIKVDYIYHHWKTWAKEIKDYADGRKVVFVNSFQYPSKYSFYTGGDFTHALNSIHYRMNQYDIWKGEDSIQGKDILLVGAYKLYDTLETSRGPFRVRKIDNFHSFYGVKVVPEPKQIICVPGEEIKITLALPNTSDKLLKFQSSDKKYMPYFVAVFHNKEGFRPLQYLKKLDFEIPPHSDIKVDVLINAPDRTGEFLCYISIVNDLILPSFNAYPINFIVSKNQ